MTLTLNAIYQITTVYQYNAQSILRPPYTAGIRYFRRSKQRVTVNHMFHRDHASHRMKQTKTISIRAKYNIRRKYSNRMSSALYAKCTNHRFLFLPHVDKNYMDREWVCSKCSTYRYDLMGAFDVPSNLLTMYPGDLVFTFCHLDLLIESELGWIKRLR